MAPRLTTAIAGIAVVACGVVPLVGVMSDDAAVAQTSAVATPSTSAAGTDNWRDLFLQRAQHSAAASPNAASITAAPRAGASKARPPRAVVASSVVSVMAVLRMVKANFPADQVGNAMAVASCESGQQSVQGARNGDGTTDWGVFQLNDGGTLQGAMRAIGVGFSSTAQAQVAGMNAELNIRAAANIWRDRGWAPWVCAYKQQIVAALYSDVPGPMYGKFTAVGDPTRPLIVGKIRDPATAKNKQPAKSKRPAPAKPATAKPKPTKPTPTPTPSPHPTDGANELQPTGSASPKPSQTPPGS